MTQVNPSISPEQEDVFTSTADSIPTFADRHEPSMALALFAVGVELRHNLRSQRAELFQLEDETIGLLSLTDAGVKLPMREQKRLSAALTGLGWVMRQVKQEGIKSRVWKRDAVPGTA